MRYEPIRTAALAAAMALSACDLDLLEKKEDETRQPATEATVVGIWRTNIPTGMSPPDPVDYKVTLDIEADHTLLFSKRLATGKPAPYDYVEVAKEYASWSVADGKLAATKTSCTYKDAATLEETSHDCADPKTWDTPIDVKGKAWTMNGGGATLVYRKD